MALKQMLLVFGAALVLLVSSPAAALDLTTTVQGQGGASYDDTEGRDLGFGGGARMATLVLLAPGHALGAHLGFHYYEHEEERGGQEITLGFSLPALGGIYRGALGASLVLEGFAEVHLGGSMSAETSAGTLHTSLGGFGAGLDLLYSFDTSSHTAVEVGPYFSWHSLKLEDDDERSNAFVFGVALQGCFQIEI